MQLIRKKMFRYTGTVAGIALTCSGISVLHAQEHSLISFLKEGEVGGHVRNYLMFTDNKEGKDFYADAIGGSISYETQSYKGFQAGVSGVFTYRMFSAPLNEPDPYTGKAAKWERELFDVNHKDNYRDLDRLEELYIRYSRGKDYVSYGKIPVAYTPLLNESDGRMKPFAFQGAWLHRETASLQLDLSWLHRFSPRSMTEWFPTHEVIGLMDNGVQPDGSPAAYHMASPTEGVGILHTGYRHKGFHVQFWDVYVDKLINTTWLQLAYQRAGWRWGAIYSYQMPHAYQRGLSYAERYVQPGEHGQVLSLSGQYDHGGLALKAAYTRAFASGRYLFPKELGRDQFFTSMSRSRLEGLGDVHVFSLGLTQHWKQWQLSVDASTTAGARPERYAYNKYTIDDYYQINTRLHYDFPHFMNGLSIDLLYVWKENKQLHDPEMMYQKSDYNQINLVTNFMF